MYYEKSEGNNRKSAIRRRRDSVMRASEIAMAIDDEEVSKNKIQPKLEISQPEDAQEKEADLVARKVVEGGDAQIANPISASSSVNTKPDGDSALYADDKLQRQLDSSKGSGQAMDDATKSEMESKMGADFSGVKIHTDSAAHTMSEDINAKAFTHGQDVYFKNGNYDPGSGAGKELLAHELHHTRQNGGGVNRKVWRAVEDIHFFKTKYESRELNDFTGLLVQVKIGSIPIYSDKKAKTSIRSFDDGTIFAIGNKVGKKYEVYDGYVQNVSTTPTGYVDEDFAFAELDIKQILPIRFIAQANANLKTDKDISYYTLRVRSGYMPVFDDVEMKTKGKQALKKGVEFTVYETYQTWGYKIGIRTPKKDAVIHSEYSDYDWTIGYIKDKLDGLNLEVIDVAKQRAAYDANKHNNVIEGSYEGYVLRVTNPLPFLMYQYPSNQFWIDLLRFNTGDEMTIFDCSDGFYFVKTTDGKRGYVQEFTLQYNRSAYEIVTIPDTAAAEVTAYADNQSFNLISISQAELENEKLKKQTIRYDVLQKVYSPISSLMVTNPTAFQPETATKVEGWLGELTNAEMGILWPEHRMVLMRAGLLLNNLEYVLRLIESASVEKDAFKAMLYANNNAMYERLQEAFTGSSDPKTSENSLKEAFGKGLGEDTVRTGFLEKALNDKDNDTVIELIEECTDQDMVALTIITRLDIITLLVKEEEGESQILSLIRTTPEIESDRALLKMLVSNTNVLDEENIYYPIIELLDGKDERDFYSLMANFYPDDVDSTKISSFQSSLIGYSADSDVAIELGINMTDMEFAQLSTKNKTDLLELMINDEWDIDAEEEGLIARVFTSFASDETASADARKYFESDLDRFQGIVASVDNEPYVSEIKTALDPIMGTSQTLVKKVMDLVYKNDQSAEDYALMLNDKALETLLPEQRVDLILRLTLGISGADSFDQDMIIRVLTTAKDQASKDRLYDWLENHHGPAPEFTKRRDQMVGAMSGANKDRFLQAVSALQGDPKALTDQEVLTTNKKMREGDEDEKIRQLSMLSDDEMASISQESRMQLLDMLAFRVGELGTIGEVVVIRMIKSTPDHQLDYLFAKLGENDGNLYDRLHKQVDAENFNTMQSDIQALADKKRIKAVSPEVDKKQREEMRQQGLFHPNVIPWKNVMGCVSVYISSGGAEMVKVRLSLSCTADILNKFLQTHPKFKHTVKKDESNIYDEVEGVYGFVDNVGVRMPEKDRVALVNQPKEGEQAPMTYDTGGKIDIMPAIGLYEMQVEEERAVREAMLLLLDIILLAVGIGELSLGLKGIRLAFAIIETALSAGALALKPFRKKLMESEDGRMFLGIYDSVMVALGLVGLVRLGYGLFAKEIYKQMITSWNKVKAGIGDAEMISAVDSALSKLGRNQNVYKKIFEVSSPDDLKEINNTINGLPNLTPAEKEGLRNLASLKLQYKNLSGKQFLDELGKDAEAGKVINDIVDEVSLTKQEKNLIRRYNNTGPGNLTEQDLVRKFRILGAGKENELFTILSMPAVKFDLLRLEVAINKVNGDLKKVKQFVDSLHGRAEVFIRVVEYIPYFKKIPVGSTTPQYFTNPANYFKKVSEHCFDKHLMECFDFNNPANFGRDIDMFIAGTTKQDVANYMDEALEKLKRTAGPSFPPYDYDMPVVLKNGLIVNIGSSMKAKGYEGISTIGHFMPQGSRSVLVKAGDLNSLKILN